MNSLLPCQHGNQALSGKWNAEQASSRKDFLQVVYVLNHTAYQVFPISSAFLVENSDPRNSNFKTFNFAKVKTELHSTPVQWGGQGLPLHSPQFKSSLWSLIFHCLPWELLGSTMITWYSYLGCSQRESVWGSKTYWWENLNPSDSFKKRLKPKHLVIQYCSTSWNHKRICAHPYGLSVRPHRLPVN